MVRSDTMNPPAPALRRPRSRTAAQWLRAQTFRAVKYPLLRRYAVRWRWPRRAPAYGWDRVSFTSGSGARLAALYGSAAGERKGVVVCLHPLRRDAKGFFLSTGRSDLLRANGYDVLLFDFNGFGESAAGDFNYVHDVLAAARYAHGRADGLPIHAFAACFGAIWTLCAATLDHPFESIVLEAPLTSMQEYYAGNSTARAFFELLWRMFPVSAANATPLHAAARISGRPRLLFIAGLDDRIAPVHMAQRLHDACSVPDAARAIWFVESAAHLRAFEVAPDEFSQRVLSVLSGEPFGAQLVW